MSPKLLMSSRGLSSLTRRGLIACRRSTSTSAVRRSDSKQTPSNDQVNFGAPRSSRKLLRGSHGVDKGASYGSRLSAWPSCASVELNSNTGSRMISKKLCLAKPPSGSTALPCKVRFSDEASGAKIRSLPQFPRPRGGAGHARQPSCLTEYQRQTPQSV